MSECEPGRGAIPDPALPAPAESTGRIGGSVELVDRTDACERWGISRARFYQLAAKPDFPEPVRVLGGGTRVWEWKRLAEWRS